MNKPSQLAFLLAAAALTGSNSANAQNNFIPASGSSHAPTGQKSKTTRMATVNLYSPPGRAQELGVSPSSTRQDRFLQVTGRNSGMDLTGPNDSLSSRVFLWGLPATGIVPPGAVGMQIHPVLFIPAYDESYGITIALHRKPSPDASESNPHWHGLAHAWPAFRGLFRH